MGHRPLVSIIINNYNYAPYLQRTIDSALDQSYRRTEVVVVDDGSTDNSREIASGYGDKIAAIFQENGGQGAACCTGFEASKGEIVMFLDADDVLHPDAAEKVINSWTDSTAKAQFCLGWIDDKDRPLGDRWPKAMPRGDVMPFVRSYGFYPSPPMTGNAFARSFLEKVLPPPSNDHWRMSFDTYLIGLAPLYGEIRSLDEVLGYYRVHGRNMSEVGGISLSRMRQRLRTDVRMQDALQEHAARLGHPLRGSLVLNVPRHCKARLISLILGPSDHPFPEDKVWRLVAAGIRAAWRFPHLSVQKRLLFSAALPVFPFLPRRSLRASLSVLMGSKKRGRLLGKLARSSRCSRVKT